MSRVPYLESFTEAERDLLVAFGMELRRCRRLAGLSQERLAVRSGVSQSTISRLERARAAHVPTLKLLRLADAMRPWLPIATCPHPHACAWHPPADGGSGIFG
jgi:DNA-binding XRE family transcriptional regulator